VHADLAEVLGPQAGGQGTFVNPAARVRHLVSARLLSVAIPNSRFHMNVKKFAPDYAGSDECCGQLQKLDAYRQARTIFIAPDNAIGTVRAQPPDDGKTVIAGTSEMRRGFYALRPDSVPPADRALVATLDGQERTGEQLALDSLRDLDSVDLVVPGGRAD
jgi:5-formyltetrahydrofolate cyclo-ligase